MEKNGTAPTINLKNSQRKVNKATHVPAIVSPGNPQPGQVLEKAAFARSLGINQAEVSALEAQATTRNLPGMSAQLPRTNALRLVAELGQAPWSDALRRFGPDLAQTSRQDLVAIGLALLDHRQAKAAWANEIAKADAVDPATEILLPAERSVDASVLNEIAKQTAVLVNIFRWYAPLQPVGALHLERLEMTPVGIEHGELVHSVPLTPHETVNIAHREWTVTTQTFESIVQDSFEGFSETGVTDKTDLSQAIESETKHSSSLDINGSVTASYDAKPYSITASVATDFSTKDESRNSIKDSVAHSVAITRTASARTRKEHKNSFRVSSVAGAEDLAVRTLTNQTPNAVRVDYFQLIRKWRIDLIRYGLRLTYDLVIPNPGIDLISQVLELQQIEEMLSTSSFSFTLAVTDVKRENYLNLAVQYGCALDRPDDEFTPTIPITVLLPERGMQVQEANFEINVPDGYAFDSGAVAGWIHDAHDMPDPNLWILDTRAGPDAVNTKDKGTGTIDLVRYRGLRGKVSVPYSFQDCVSGQINGSYQGKLRDETFLEWQLKAWATLREAAQADFDRNLALAKDRKAFLDQQIRQFDALTLRKMEHEEVMKWVLKWLLGGFPLEASPVSVLAKAWPSDPSPIVGVDPACYPPPDPQRNPRSPQQEVVLRYEEFVKFIHNAIEWENILFLSYPYFWDACQNWPFKRFLMHPDPVHREFLRAGATRVVLTIRPGFEEQFMVLTQTGKLERDPTKSIDSTAAPYVSVGQELHNQDLTNYQNIPPANPDCTARPLLYALQRDAWDHMQSIIGALEYFNEKNNHYPPGTEASVPGLPRLLKGFLMQQMALEGSPSFADMLWSHLKVLNVTPGLTFNDPNSAFIDPWGNPYHYTRSSAATPVLHGDYELVCYGSDNKKDVDGVPSDPNDPLSEDITSWAEGLLVAQWYEYTPTSALDVSVDTTLSINGPALAG
jgi:hypothetical protein